MPEAPVRGATSASLALAPSRHDDRPVTPLRRMPVAVLVSRFPLVTETFVLRELIELERQGQPVVLVPLLRQDAAVVHPDARPWMERALYTPFVSRGIAAANWRTLRRRPFTYLRLLFQLVRGNAGSPGILLRTLALFPKTVFLAERLAALGVGHVHAHFATHPGMAAYAIHRLIGLPYSITAHAHDIFVRRDMLREKLAAARFVRCISDFNRRYLASHYPESRDRLSVMHVGVGVDHDAARARAAPARERRVLCVAALKPYKGHAILVEACRRLVERRVAFVCDLVGEGPLRPKLEAAIVAAGLQERVRVLGARPEHEVAVLMAGAAVVVQPSIVARDGQMEGIPVALMEAMAAGKPVVASALSGVPELVEDGVSGLLVAPGDAEALAIALERLLNGPQAARSMGEQGRRKVAREFDLTDTVAQLLNAMDRHLQAPPASGEERPSRAAEDVGGGRAMTEGMADVVREDLAMPVAAIGRATEADGVDHAGRGLARIAARGAAWSLVGTVGARLVSLLSLAVLARLLSPADFGLVAFALVYITYLETVADLGTGAALIWWPGRRDDAAQAAFVLNTGTGLVWVALTMTAAPYVAAFFRTPAGEPVLQALSWVFLLKALGSTHDALCQKELRFRAQLVPELGSGTVKAVVAIGLAASGFGAWSLVWGQLAGQAVWAVLMWRVVPWRPRWLWPRGLLRPMLRYGRGIVSVNVLSAVVHHADLVIVGRLLGATALGMYQVAYKLPEAAITVLVWVTSRVLFPTLSRLNADSAALGRGWLAAVRYTSLLTFPAAAGLAVCAAPVVRLVFGERWLSAAPVLAGLAVAAGLRSAGSNAGDVLKAAGRPGLLAALGVVKAIVLVPALVMAASRGPAAVAWTLAAVTAFNAVLSVALSSRLAAVSVGDYARAVGPALGVAGCVALAAWSALRFAPTAELPAAVLVGIAALLLATRAFAPEALRGAVEAFRGGPAEDAGGARRAGRIVVGTGDRPLLDFAARELLVPHTRAERLVRALSPAAARALLLRRDGLQPEPPWMSAAVGVTSGFGPLRGALEQRRFILNERMEGGRSAGGLLLLFDSGSAEPRAALKVRPAGGPLWREHETLMELHGRLPPALARAVPPPIGYSEEDAWEALLLPWHRGHSPYVEMQRLLRPARRSGVHLQAAARWLAEFHAATREPAEPRPDADVPLAFGHGDYWPRNLLLQGDTVSAVLDWERSGPGRPVTEDVFHFALTYALNFRWTAAGRAAPDEAFRRGFLQRGPVSAEIGRFLRSYCTAMRLPPRRLAVLFERQLPTLSEVAGLPTELAAALRQRWATARWSVFEG